ncbi:MAG: hypothetical protein NTY53_01900, partial [Kiritimatiellaeota bacterium]|nr:hypothetical protein [Kiritimatiellota bacterium]
HQQAHQRQRFRQQLHGDVLFQKRWQRASGPARCQTSFPSPAGFPRLAIERPAFPNIGNFCVKFSEPWEKSAKLFQGLEIVQNR